MAETILPGEFDKLQQSETLGTVLRGGFSLSFSFLGNLGGERLILFSDYGRWHPC